MNWIQYRTAKFEESLQLWSQSFVTLTPLEPRSALLRCSLSLLSSEVPFLLIALVTSIIAFSLIKRLQDTAWMSSQMDQCSDAEHPYRSFLRALTDSWTISRLWSGTYRLPAERCWLPHLCLFERDGSSCATAGCPANVWHRHWRLTAYERQDMIPAPDSAKSATFMSWSILREEPHRMEAFSS